MVRSLLLLVAACAIGCSTSIQHGLDERQANEIHAALTQRGIEASKEAETGRTPTWSVRVPTQRAAESVQVLSELGLPRPRAEGWREVYGKGGWVPSASEERALYLTALSGELSRTLEAFDGVIAARVHLVLPVAPRSGVAAVAAKASVFLRVRMDAAARLHGERAAIQALVAGGVEGLAPEAVTLVFEPVASHRPAPPPASPRLPLAAVAAGFVVIGSGTLAWGLVRWPRRRAVARKEEV